MTPSSRIGYLLEVCILVLATCVLAPSPAAAQTAFEPGTEGQIWKQLPYVGATSCSSIDADGYCVGPFDLSLGKYQFPKAIVTDLLPAAIPGHDFCDAGHTVANANPRVISYVTDQWNNRLQAFDYCGNPVAFTSPSTPNGTIDGLALPESLAVDSTHHIIVADRDHSRIAIFNQDGSFNAAIAVPFGSLPSGVAAFPGTDAGTSGYIAVVLSASPNSHLRIYSAVTGALLAENPQPESCGDVGAPPLPGGLCQPSSLTIDAAGVMYVADYPNNRINVYTAHPSAATITYQYTFGVPGDYPIGTTSPAAQPNLQLPCGLISLNVTLSNGTVQQRLLVSDQYNQRLAVYSISYPQAGVFSNPTIDFLFYLDARGDLDGFPSGVAQDALGRVYAVDTGNHRVQRFEVPELAIVDVHASPAGMIPSGSVFAVTAGVAVPIQKSGLNNVVAALCLSADGQTPCTSGQVSTPNATYADGPSPAAVATIGAGQVAYYTWHYSASAGGSATFTIGATGGPSGIIAADPVKTITVPLGCASCETRAAVTASVLSAAGHSGSFYSNPITVSLSATDSSDSANPSAAPSGVQQIRVHFSGAQGGGTLGPAWPRCAIQYDPMILEYCADAASPAATFVAPPFLITSEGTSTVLYRAVDAVGNIEAMRSATVTVDSIAPLPTFSDPTVNGNGWHGGTGNVTVSYTLGDSNGSGVDATVSPGAGSRSFTAEGTTSWTFKAQDRVGNSADISYSVNIDRTSPTISATPATAELTSLTATPATVTVTASDALSGIDRIAGPQTATYAFTSGQKQAQYPVSFTAFDQAGNSTTASTTVTIVDTTPPAFTVSLPSTVALKTGVAGTVALPDYVAGGQVSATDLNKPVTLSVAVTKQGGGAAALSALTSGTYTAVYTATDGAGNKSTASVTVAVNDQRPVFTAPANISLIIAGAGAVVTYATPTATDTTDGTDPVICSPASGSTFAIGTTTVTCTSKNSVGQITTHTFTVTLTNNRPPVCTAAVANAPSLWPPDHRLVNVGITGVTDPDHNPVTLKIVSIFQDEPTNGGGDGNTAIDGFGVGTGTAQVRAERGGSGNGRVYYITFAASDPAGGSCTGTVMMGVPHDMAHPAIGEGPRYNSTVATASSDQDEHEACGDAKDRHNENDRGKSDRNRRSRDR